MLEDATPFGDGVLMAPGTTSMKVSAMHTIEAIVRDGRGATKTAKKVVSCTWCTGLFDRLSRF